MVSAAGQKKVNPRECSIADALELVGQRWALLIVRELSHGMHRFDQIVHRTGAPRDILTVRLRALEAAGVIRRERYSTNPPRFEYHLTESGWELCDVLLMLMQWGDRHLNADDPPLRLVHACEQGAGSSSSTGPSGPVRRLPVLRVGMVAADAVHPCREARAF